MTSFSDMFKILVAKRWHVFLGLFVFEVATIVVVANSKFFPGEYSNYQNQYNSIKPVLSQDALGQVASIFLNNFRVAMAELIPGFGPLLFGFSIYETARIVEVIGLSQQGGIGAALGTLLILPSTWLELPAYAISVTESIYLLAALVAAATGRGKRVGSEILILVLNIFLIAGVLIIAATIEVLEIKLESGPVPALALLTWLPAVVILALVVRFWRRARREAPALEGPDPGSAPSMPGPPPPSPSEGGAPASGGTQSV